MVIPPEVIKIYNNNNNNNNQACNIECVIVREVNIV